MRKFLIASLFVAGQLYLLLSAIFSHASENIHVACHWRGFKTPQNISLNANGTAHFEDIADDALNVIGWEKAEDKTVVIRAKKHAVNYQESAIFIRESGRSEMLVMLSNSRGLKTNINDGVCRLS